MALQRVLGYNVPLGEFMYDDECRWRATNPLTMQRTSYEVSVAVHHALQDLQEYLPVSQLSILANLVEVNGKATVVGFGLSDTSAYILRDTELRTETRTIRLDQVGLVTGQHDLDLLYLVPVSNIHRQLIPMRLLEAGEYSATGLRVGTSFVFWRVQRLRVPPCPEGDTLFVDEADPTPPAYPLDRTQTQAMETCVNHGIRLFRVVQDEVQGSVEVYPMPDDNPRTLWVEWNGSAALPDTLHTPWTLGCAASSSATRYGYWLEGAQRNVFLMTGAQQCNLTAPVEAEVEGFIETIRELSRGRRDVQLVEATPQLARMVRVRVLHHSGTLRPGDKVRVRYRRSRTVTGVLLSTNLQVLFPVSHEDDVNTTAMLLLEDLIEDLDQLDKDSGEIRTRLQQILLLGQAEDQVQSPPQTDEPERYEMSSPTVEAGAAATRTSYWSTV